MRRGAAPRRKVSVPTRLADPQKPLTLVCPRGRAPDGASPRLGLRQLGSAGTHSGEWINHPKTGGEWGVPNEKATGGEDKASGGDQGPSREERGEHMRKIKRGKKKKRGIWCLVCGRSRRDRRERETTKGHRREDSCGEVIEMGCGARGVGQSAHGGETKGRG